MSSGLLWSPRVCKNPHYRQHPNTCEVPPTPPRHPRSVPGGSQPQLCMGAISRPARRSLRLRQGEASKSDCSTREPPARLSRWRWWGWAKRTFCRNSSPVSRSPWANRARWPHHRLMNRRTQRYLFSRLLPWAKSAPACARMALEVGATPFSVFRA